MRFRAGLSIILAVLCALAMRADRSRAADGDGERVYVAAGAELRYATSAAPLPTRTLGAAALAALERVRGDRDAEVPAIVGEGAAPEGWPASLPGDAATGEAPLAGVPAGWRSCRCGTAIGREADERVAALYTTADFEVAGELDELRVLRLRAEFEDGLIAWINGREVARRNLDRGAGPMDTAERPHGPEWETFYIPVTDGLLRRGTNTLSVEVRPSGHRLSPSLDLELRAEPGAARIVRGPMIQKVGTDSAVVVFDTDVPARARVHYGATDELGLTADSAGGGLAVHHVVPLPDLAPGAVHYQVVTGGDASATHRFHTAPAAGEVIRFVAYGDVRGGHRVHARLVEEILDEGPDFVVVTGDLVLRGSDEADWQTFFSVTAELLARVPYYPAAGNHDLGRSGDEQRRMNEIFELWPGPADRPEWGHWYSFDVGGVHFVMLDSNAYEHDEQLEWLERDLAAAKDARAIFAVVHDGPYSRGIHRGNRYAAEHYAPVLAEHDVTMLFAGHDHIYQRGEVDGLRYMVSGGGGAPLYPIRCGVKGRPACKVDDGMQHVAREHHYIMVTVYPEHAELCPKRKDGSPLERCVTVKL